MNYNVRLGVDGFWSLYIEGVPVYDIHEDNIPENLSRDEIERFVSDSYEVLD